MQGPPLTNGMVGSGVPKTLHLHACSHQYHIYIYGSNISWIASIHEIWSCLSSHDCENEDIKKLDCQQIHWKLDADRIFASSSRPPTVHTVGLNLGNYSHLDCPVSKVTAYLSQLWTYSCVSPGLTMTKMWVVSARKFPWRKTVLPNYQKVFWPPACPTRIGALNHVEEEGRPPEGE